MDKQKQIEEMEKSCTDCIHYEICSLWATTDLDKDEAYRYCFGRYRPKIPENAVVLTREEYKKLKNGEMTYNQMVRIITEKLAERLKEKMHKGKALHAPVLGKEYVQRIIRETVDEIRQEITEGKV